MAVAQALQAASSALRRNPVIIGIVLLISLIQLPTQFAQLAGPVVSAVLSLAFTVVTVVVTPFVFGGLIGMADEALDGTTSLATFVNVGKRYYTSMLVAYLLLFGGALVLGFAAAVISIAIALLVGGLSGTMTGGLNTVFIVTMFVTTALFLLLLFVPLFFVQFYGQAIVLNGETAVGGYKRSIGLVRQNLMSVLGYSVLVFGVGMFFGLIGSIPATLLSMQVMPVPPTVPLPDLSLLVVIVLTVLGNIVLGLLGSLFLVFSVAFYRTLDSLESSGEPSTPEGTVA